MNVATAAKYGLFGLAAVVVAPVVLPIAGQVLKPVVKGVLKAGMVSFQKGRVFLEETKETWGDLAAETKAELQSTMKESMEEAKAN